MKAAQNISIMTVCKGVFFAGNLLIIFLFIFNIPGDNQVIFKFYRLNYFIFIINRYPMKIFFQRIQNI